MRLLLEFGISQLPTKKTTESVIFFIKVSLFWLQPLFFKWRSHCCNNYESRKLFFARIKYYFTFYQYRTDFDLKRRNN